MSNKKSTVKQKKNSHQFKKGQSGNPNGRPPKKLCIPDILRKIINEPLDSDEKSTKLESIMNRVVNMALKGNKWAIEFIANRTEGKPKETIQKIDIDQIQEIRMI